MSRHLLYLATASIAFVLAGALRSSPAVHPDEPPRDRDGFAADGRIEGHSETIRVGTSSAGRVDAVNVVEGDVVRQGQILATVSCAPVAAQMRQLRARVDAARQQLIRGIRGARSEERAFALTRVRAAEARRARTRADWQRANQLFNGDGLISRAQFEAAAEADAVAEAEEDAARSQFALVDAELLPEDRARLEAELAAAKFELDAADAHHEQCLIRSPIDGIVTRRLIEPGEHTALAAQQLFWITDTSRLQIRVEVDERDVHRVHIGQSVTVRTEALADGELTATVIRVAPVMGRKTVYSGAFDEKYDRDILEVIASLTGPRTLPIGLRVTAVFDGSGP